MSLTDQFTLAVLILTAEAVGFMVGAVLASLVLSRRSADPACDPARWGRACKDCGDPLPSPGFRGDECPACAGAARCVVCSGRLSALPGFSVCDLCAAEIRSEAAKPADETAPF